MILVIVGGGSLPQGNILTHRLHFLGLFRCGKLGTAQLPRGTTLTGSNCSSASYLYSGVQRLIAAQLSVATRADSELNTRVTHPNRRRRTLK